MRRRRNRFLCRLAIRGMSSTVVCRFAPSPNGYLHLGHALSALVNFNMARESGGRFLLRIEDIDLTRCRSEFETAIYEDLAWLGIAWDGEVRRQSEHFDDYRSALAELEAQGLLYPSFESRAEIAAEIAAAPAPWPCDPDGAPLYPGTARNLSPSERGQRIAAGEPYALRLDVAAAIARVASTSLTWNESGLGPAGETGTIAIAPERWGDVILGRKEMPASYHLAVAIDDALQGITHVVRGRDLFWATSVHRLLQALLGLPTPAYRHHRLILDEHDRKLSKSTQATALRSLRASGLTAADIRRMVGLD
jgi:glutamyl-Q tRNA(Asp) synthetase